MTHGTRRASGLFVLLALLPCAAGEDGKFSIKTADSPPPKELSAAMQALLTPKAMQLIDTGGKTVCEVWLRKEVPADATPEQIKNGITYREIKQTEVVGAIRFEQEWRDYRKQKVKAGTYTLRLAYQPMDGDHMGSSESQDFLAIIDAAKDAKPEVIDAKHMIETSAKSVGTGHPAVFMLFATPKPAAEPALVAMPKSHWVLQAKEDITVGGKKAGSLGFGITLVGAAE